MSQSTSTDPVRPLGRRVYVLGALGGGIRGYELGVIGGALLFAGPELGLGKYLTGWVVAAALIGSLGGALAAGPLSDRYGRRILIALGGALYTVGIVIASLAGNAEVLILGRVVLGLAVGIATAMIPVYIGELAPARIRGASASLFQLLITTGVLLANIVAYLLSDDKAWRWMFGIGAFPALVMLAGAFFLPESPRWLVTKGRTDDARSVLRRTRTAGEVESEIAGIIKVNEARRSQLGLRDLLANHTLRRLLIVGSVLGILQQFIGVNAVTYYAPTVLKSIGFSDSASILSGVGFAVLGFIFTTVMVFFVVDRVGRRKPLIVGSLVMAAAMAVLGSLYVTVGAHAGTTGYIAIICFAVFQVAFALSWGGIVWTVLGEIYPLRIRGAAMGIATFMTEAASVIVSLFFPTLLGVGAGTVFFIFAGMGVVAFFWVTFLLPETRHRSLEEIETSFEGGFAPVVAAATSSRSS